MNPMNVLLTTGTLALTLGGCGSPAAPEGGAAATGGSGSGGTGADEPSRRRICDGSDELRFAARIPRPGMLVYGQEVVLELGLVYLFVSGTCDFAVWTKSPTIWEPARLGRLDVETSEGLAAAFEYELWPERDGLDVSDSLLDDQAPWLLTDGTHHLTRLPTDGEWLERLYQLGTDASGPVRLRVLEDMESRGREQPVGGERLWVEWPLSESPEKYVEPSPYTEEWGDAHLITDPEEVAALRALRPELIHGSPPGYQEIAHVKTVTTQPRYYYFAFRDVIPFEDAFGNVPGFSSSRWAQ